MTAQHLDHGLPCLALCLSLLVWVLVCSSEVCNDHGLIVYELMHCVAQLEMGVRHRFDIQRCCRRFHRVLWRGDVRIETLQVEHS